MTSTVARESMPVPAPSELDSEGSSCGEERDTRKRSRDDLNYPKKRRKQTTPVRFPVSFNTQNERTDYENDEYNDNDNNDNDDEMENTNILDDNIMNDKNNDEESFIQQQLTKDENLNTEFRCQYCNREFDNNNCLSNHLNTEHDINNLSQSQIPSPSSKINYQGNNEVRVKLETQNSQQDEIEIPVNLSGIGIKNFTPSWLSSSSHGQLQETDWSNQNPLTTISGGHLPGLPFPGGLAQYLPMPGFSLDAGQLPRMPVGPAPMRIFNPDAYCDLCHKEFCNKYFLKTHKANKHGIYTDPPTSNSSENSGSSQFTGIPFSVGGIKIEQPVIQQQQQSPSQIQPQAISTQPQQQPRQLDPLSAQAAGISLIPTIPCDICQKRFKNDESLRKHKQRNHSDLSIDQQSESQSLPASGTIDEDRDPQHASPSAIESLFKQEFCIEQEDTKFMPAPRHLSPQSIQQAKDSNFSAERLRKLGVLNPEAFCELCCKEYCNKYFLRTHKIKRHGVFIQDSEKSPCNPGAAATWHQIQTSPLNLIVSDSNQGDSESNDKTEECECKLCGIRFQTIGLYHVHMAKIHTKNNDVDDDEDVDNNDVNNDSNDDEKLSPKQDIDEERTDSISEDLQKLQTMILQLNGIESSKSSTCGICGRECENQLALKTHMNLEHGTNVQDDISSLSPIQTIDNSTYCILCEKDYPTQELLRQHITDEHNSSSAISNNKLLSITNSSSNIPTVTIPTLPSGIPGPPIPPPPDKKLSSMTPTSSYCEICNKELCNKYFMKTHMQRMHGIEIENGSQIGGVICNICNKELCSKYFLRVHKHNTHGIVDDSTTTQTINKTDNNTFDTTINSDESLKSDNISGDLSHRYFSHFTEICPLCSTRFRSIKWLKTHLMGEHGRAGIDKWRELEIKYQQNTTRNNNKFINSSTSRINIQNTNLKIPNGIDITTTSTNQLKANDYSGLGNQVLSTLFGGGGGGSNNDEQQQAKNYRCSYCNFTTPVLPFLFLHERSHTTANNQENIGDNGLQCPICSQIFLQPELLHHHLLTRHQLSGLLSQFSNLQSSIINNPSIEINQDNNDMYEQQKDEFKNDNNQIQSTNIDNIKNQKDDNSTVEVTPQGAYKCAQCGFATANLNRIKKHVRKDHRSIGDPTECVIAELSKTLKDVASKQKLPASYAMPQDMNSNPDTTVMQPFIIEEQDCGNIDDKNSMEKRFAPALVYLPVRTRVSSVLTASFTLSPA